MAKSFIDWHRSAHYTLLSICDWMALLSENDLNDDAVFLYQQKKADTEYGIRISLIGNVIENTN